MLNALYRQRFTHDLNGFMPAARVESVLAAVDYCEVATGLPYEDIARPYYKILLTGKELKGEQLLLLLDSARRLCLTFAVFVDELLLPWVLTEHPPLVDQFTQMFAAA
ncbi:hypothetical protein [Hymenobacter sp. YC55]|uniref:hypothetical protein n=1 Tax=Hymenobacter sp. YC55 TaxID=3034019 RepID=UPI0023F768F4|nr:hypothetical protein [Hymenobacter sp. YC55]MDF7809932.1 hypothetical protein [Hymenobacter sp. YC55]